MYQRPWTCRMNVAVLFALVSVLCSTWNEFISYLVMFIFKGHLLFKGGGGAHIYLREQS